MEQLPKIVRERLQASQSGAHPDPDLLAAFSEQSLTQRERTQILEHLSRCGECREVISLATPEPALSSKSHPVPSVSGWLRWPVLRWGALAACVVVVGAVGLLYRERTLHPQVQPMTDTRSVVMTDLQKPAEAEKPREPSGRATPATRAERRDTLRAALPRIKTTPAGQTANQAEHFDRLAKATPPAPPAVQATADANQVALNFKDEVSAVPGPSEKPQAAPSTAYLGTFTGPIAGVKSAPSNMAAKDEQAKSDHAVAEVVAVAPKIPAPEVKSAKRKAEEGGAQKLPKQVDSDVTETQAAFATERLASTAASTNARNLLRDLKSARWSLSDDGLPQRSFNAGNTWEKVQVDHATGFRALSAQGFDVWVGGRNGALYHSTDLGLHWTRVTPMIEGAALSAGIVRIEFTDSLHGKITTAENQILVTSDGGKSWQKQ